MKIIDYEEDDPEDTRVLFVSLESLSGDDTIVIRQLDVNEDSTFKKALYLTPQEGLQLMRLLADKLKGYPKEALND